MSDKLPRGHFVYAAHPALEPYRVLARDSMIHTDMFYISPSEISTLPDTSRRPFPQAYHDIDPSSLAPDMVVAPDYRGHYHIDTSDFEPEELTDGFLANGGLNTLSGLKVWPGGLVNDGWRLTRPTAEEHEVQAAEMLASGAGTLQPRTIRPTPKAMERGQYRAGRVVSRLAKVTGTYLGDLERLPDGRIRPLVLESTTAVSPEVVGTIQQIVERADEANFLSGLAAYVSDVATSRQWGFGGSGQQRLEIAASTDTKFPASQAAMRGHLATGVWQQPPRDGRELLDRAERILDALVIDTDPYVKYGKSQPFLTDYDDI